MRTQIFWKYTWRGRIVRYAPLLVWFAIIFYASTSQGSMSRTSFFVRPLLEFLFPGASEQTLIYYQIVVRKFAHLFLYGGLGFFSSRAFFGSETPYIRRFWPYAAFCLVVLTAVADELNQSMNTLRTGSANDVFLDIAGGLVLIGLFAAGQKIQKKL